MDPLVERVRAVLSDDLLKPEYRDLPDRKATTGHCYVACEALFHLWGGKAAGMVPTQIRHEGASHWFLRTPSGVVDPTGDQFETAVPYELGVGRGFQTRQPSRRAAEVIRRVGTI